LKAQPGGVTPTTAHRSTISPEQAALGKSVYEDNCASCHQSDGSGQKANIPALAGNKALASQQPNDVIMAVLYGFPPQGTWGPMASFAKTLNDDQIAAVANYVRTAWGNGGEPNALAWSVGNWREQMTPAEQNPNAALICPNLAPDVLRPALRADPHALLQAATDQGKLNSVVSGYTKARPGSSTAEVIEALSTAYCRAVVKSPASRVTNEARIAEFSQRVAITLAKNTAKASP
jgi:mono/diheme cytochrome c family protein